MIASKKSIQMCMYVTWILCLLFVCSDGVAQTPKSNPTASVSGRVTIAGKGAEGITVVATVSESQWQNRTVAKAVTDGEGNYSLTKLAAGRLTITPIAKAFVADASGVYSQPGQSVNVAEDESITKIDFALVRGGVITGRITEIDGRPIIGERVNVVNMNGSGGEAGMGIFPQSRNQTDDRGVYRIYGLGPGKYKVSVGRAASKGSGANAFGMGGSRYTMTFYPGVAESPTATAIEVSEGSETTDIDITPGKFARGFSVSGRVVNASSNQPVANVYIAYSKVSDENQRLGQMNFIGVQSDTNGKFRLEGVEPGNYAAYTMAMGQENSYSDPAPFYVSSGDVTGIEVKVRLGAIVEGVAVIENTEDTTATGLLQSVTLFAYVTGANNTSAPSFGQAKINPDGSFRFVGLSPGHLGIQMSGFPNPPSGLELVRTEFQGQEQGRGIEVTAGARITGVRLVFTYGTGKIRGELKIEDGTWPEGIPVMLSIQAVEGTRQYTRSIDVDARGHFVAENLPPGAYELRLRSGAETAAFEPIERNINISNGTEVPITIVIELVKEKEGPE